MNPEELLKRRREEFGDDIVKSDKSFLGWLESPFAIRLTNSGLLRVILSPDDIELIVDLTIERLKKYLVKEDF